jgi:hypothetical protein
MEFVDGVTPSSGGEVTESSSRGISRRSVIKVGAAAAWSVPLVQVVAAAPAVATSHSVGIALAAPPKKQGQRLELSFIVTYGNVSTDESLIVKLTFPGGSKLAFHNGQSTTGWTRATSGTVATFSGNPLSAAGEKPLVVQFSTYPNPVSDGVASVELRGHVETTSFAYSV